MIWQKARLENLRLCRSGAEERQQRERQND